MAPDDDPQFPPEPDASRIARLARALASSHDGFWERNLRTNQSWYSPSFRALFGFAEGELPNDRNVVNARIHPDDLPGFLAAYEQAIRTLQPFTYEVRYRDRHEQWRWIRGRGKVWAGADGKAEIIAGALSDVNDAKTAQLALQQMTERFERAVHAGDEGLFERVVDEDAMYLSDRLVELLGYTRGEMPARRSTLIDHMHPEDRARYLGDASQAIGQLQRLELTLRMRHRTQGYRWFRLRAQAYRDSDERVRITGMLADIHDQVLAREEIERHGQHLEEVVHERTARLESALAQAEAQRAEAERANETKSLFLAHMSHEMRTPLNGVLGLTDLALRVAQSPVQQRYLELAMQSGRALLHLIDDVLDFSRMAAGKLQLADEPFDLADLMSEAIRGVASQLRAKGLGWRFDYIGEATQVRGDRARLRQIVTNLLGNAAKFTEHGHVEIVVRVEPAGEKGLNVEISVRDTGPGLDAKAQERVFEAFVQGDASLTRRHGGTGLGLSIARGLAHAMGGTLTLHSAPGEGALFTLRVTLGGTAGPALPLPAPGRVWLVYSKLDLGEWIARRFERLGWSARVVPALDEACRQAREGPRADRPELVVVAEHVVSPGSDLRALRDALPDAHVALVIRPDWNQPQTEQRALQLGMTLAVAPLTPRDLRSLLERPAASEATAQAEDRAVAHAMATSAMRPVARAAAERVLLVEDNAVNRLIATELLEGLGADVQAVDGGEAALAACVHSAPDLVLMDLQMPGMDGFEACKRMRTLQNSGELPWFPIVALTAHAMAHDRAACLAAGMDGFLTKPIVVDALRGELSRWLRTLG